MSWNSTAAGQPGAESCAEWEVDEGMTGGKVRGSGHLQARKPTEGNQRGQCDMTGGVFQ